MPTAIADIRAAKPDILLIGISSPKREYFYDCAYTILDVQYVIGVGGAFDILAGVASAALANVWAGAGCGDACKNLPGNTGVYLPLTRRDVPERRSQIP
jgi:hypothetical protein